MNERESKEEQVLTEIALHLRGSRGCAVGWGNTLQAGRSRVRLPMVPLEFFIDAILTAALCPWGWFGFWQKLVPEIFPGTHSWQPYHLRVPTVLKSGSLNLLEPSGPVQACNGIALPRRSRVRFPMVPLDFFIDTILTAALCPWGWFGFWQKRVPEIFPGTHSWQPCHLRVPTVLKSGNLNLLEPSGPVRACNGIVLPLHYTYENWAVQETETVQGWFLNMLSCWWRNVRQASREDVTVFVDRTMREVKFFEKWEAWRSRFSNHDSLFERCVYGGDFRDIRYMTVIAVWSFE
jgi:hypothetical protein